MTSVDREAEEAFVHGFHGLPSARERDAMSVIKIAELLSHQPEGSVPHVVLSHELNLKIAKVQSKATLSAGWIGAASTVSAAVLTFVLGYYLGSSAAQSRPPASSTSTNLPQSGTVGGVPSKNISPTPK